MTINDLFNNSLNAWKANHGRGIEVIPSPIDIRCEVLAILYKFLTNGGLSDIYVIVPDYSTRYNLIQFLADNEVCGKDIKQAIDNKSMKVWTMSIYLKQTFRPRPRLGILYKPKSIEAGEIQFSTDSKWFITIVPTILGDNSLTRLKLPMLNGMPQKDIDTVLSTTPVEESRIAVTLPDNSEDSYKLREYEEYIQTSMNIFGSLDVLESARKGDVKCNISAASVCNMIATENGWSETLDMSVPFNVEIDKVFNPINIMERASITYNIFRYRNKLLSDSKYKIDAILDIVRENMTKKILIVNKSQEFAILVRDAINTCLDDICGCWLSNMLSIPAVDIDGNPIYLKSGPNRGERKMMGGVAQSKLNQELFNRGKLNVLSTNNAPDKSLAVDVDILIITSPMCEDVRNIQYRLSNTKFSYPLTLYSLYVKNTLEQKRLQNKVLTENHTIVKDCENDVLSENNCDIVIVE